MQKKGGFLGFSMKIYYLCTMINDNDNHTHNYNYNHYDNP